ncbi:MAG: rod shape-determining protein MreC [Oscillospiraceae bacterium]|nr:rod shape-determining protein MreC [Oscillospiraceae bacterium]
MTKFKDFIKKNGIRLGIVVVMVALIFGVVARGTNGNAGVVENAAASLSTPVERGSTGFVGWLEGVYGYMFKYDSLAAENEELKVKLAEAEIKLREAKNAENENERLRELLSLREKHKDFVFESANIIDRPSSNWSETYTLSKGEESGVAVGNCVIDSCYNLVGQVIEVGTGWATVRAIIDADIRVGALVGEGGNAAMIVGDFSLMQKGETKLTYLTEETQVLEGDVLITSGKGGAFPKGLKIGTVTAVQTEAGGQVEYATVTPASELGALSEVFVIKDFEVVD